MIWLTPVAWFGIVALVAPVAIHLLVHRRSEPFPFPTLQFLQPTRLASIRRRLLDDIALMIVRCAVLAAAVAALAGPLIVTASRRASWNARVARAIVVDTAAPDGAERSSVAQQEAATAFRSEIFEASRPGDGLRRAAAWLDEAPPARREIVCVSPLALGSITAADLQALPKNVGVRFVRSGTLPASRTVDADPVMTRADTQAAAYAALRRSIMLNGGETRVAEAAAPSPLVLALDFVVADEQRATMAAAVAAVAAGRTLVPAPDRSARLVLAGAPDYARAVADAAPIRLPWAGDAVARITRDEDVSRVASEVRAARTDPSLRSAPWHTIAAGADGAPLIVAAQSGDRLLVALGAAAGDVLTPVLIRAIVNAMAAPRDLHAAEVVPIPDALIRSWERPSADVDAHIVPRNTDADGDDRRWFWGAALALLGLETWMRRGRARVTSSLADVEERADRVA